MARTETRSWDIVDSLNSDERIAAYLDAALEDGDPQLILAALGDIARAKGMTEVARNAGLGRQSLYKALSSEGNPEFATVLKVIKSLGLRLTVSP
ncbi:addiction module antidote protein [Azospirillum ramasamyi]|uniref:Putative addiction module antidote protein n=1 Tax=Azospirillum ramasamyi TaxID=682998 RepID=A0A2U9S5V8_9PROT|nr:addiction module antidote protein [Azospirillum ramasamyi]AWU93298.1 putative addiction module antidote protein [Azospirillum ramasamyi]